jgi:nucleoid-associated protein YgaU
LLVNAMLTRNRRIIGIGILVAGFCAAIPYQRQASEEGPAGLNDSLVSSRQLSDQPLQLSIVARNQVDGTTPIQSLQDQDRIKPLRIEAPLSQVEPADAPSGPGPAIPSIDDRFPVTALPVLPSNTTPLIATPTDRLTLIRPAQRRSHRVEDGDTLSQLATDYLGSAQRAGEIYQLNRERLSSAELLPLGLVLEIPAN